MSTQATPEQILAHAKAELGRLERQREVTVEGHKQLGYALADLEMVPPDIASALARLVQYQIGPVELALNEMDIQREKLVEFIRQKESPILGASLIPPSGAGFGRRG